MEPLRSHHQLVRSTFIILAVLMTSVVTQWPKHVYREDWKERTCSKMLRQVTHRHVTVEVPPQLDGQWTSHRCEIRSGPEFVVRSYNFEGTRFESRLFHYEDPDCSRPQYGFLATGKHHLLQESWVIPGAMEAKYRVDEVQLVAYSPHTALRLLNLLKSVCPTFSPTLVPYRKYTIVKNYWKNRNSSLSSPLADGSHDFDCSAALNFSLNELQLIRSELRVYQRGGQSTNRITETNSGNAGRGGVQRGRAVRELLLGDVHTELSERQRHRPTSFQEPLRDVRRALCGVCSRISHSGLLDPPRLGVHQGTLVSLEGEWVSTRCESRQYGQFLTRWLHFLSDGQSWEGRYDYYRDALCRQPAFTLRAKGSYAGGLESKVMRGSKGYSFKTTRLKVTPRDSTTVENLNRYRGGSCGVTGAWRRDQEQDVTSTSGCSPLGIQLPFLEQDLMRMEALHRKLLLYVSQRATDQPVRPYSHPPPAAFQPPLVKCGAHDLDMSINSLPEVPLAHALAQTSGTRVGDRVLGAVEFSSAGSGCSLSYIGVVFLAVVRFV